MTLRVDSQNCPHYNEANKNMLSDRRDNLTFSTYFCCDAVSATDLPLYRLIVINVILFSGRKPNAH